jgi:GTP-binding protein HflX
MFATLDPTVRHVTLPSRRKVLASDTVGFIRNLPTTLVRAFRATLEEVVEAELLLHVVDASAPSAAEHTAHVLDTLTEIGAGTTPQILVLNKSDLISDDPDAAALARRILGDPEHQPAGAVAISAQTGAGFDELLGKIDETLSMDPIAECEFRIPAGDGASLHILHERARVLSKKYDGDWCRVKAIAPASVRRLLAEHAVGAIM